MYQVEIPLPALNRVDLPAVCPLTGTTEGIEYRKVKFQWYPRWITLLALPALLIAAILAAIMTKRANGEMPFGPGAYRRWKLGWAGFVTSGFIAIAGVIVMMIGLSTNAPAQAAVGAVLAFPLPLGTWFLFVRGKHIRVVEIRDDALVVKVPSEVAANAWREKLSKGYTGLSPGVAQALQKEAAATQRAPEGAKCATHPEVAAAWACGRCGSFFCEACAKTPMSGGPPLCTKCVALRAQALGPAVARTSSLRRLQSFAVGLAVVSLVPGCSSGGLISLLINGVALYQTLRTPDRPRWYLPVIGLGLSAVNFAVWAVIWPLG